MNGTNRDSSALTTESCQHLSLIYDAPKLSILHIVISTVQKKLRIFSDVKSFENPFIKSSNSL